VSHGRIYIAERKSRSRGRSGRRLGSAQAADQQLSDGRPGYDENKAALEGKPYPLDAGWAAITRSLTQYNQTAAPASRGIAAACRREAGADETLMQLTPGRREYEAA
jgi:hypothetical protein